MGNNAAYSTFEYTVVTIYDHGVLTLELLDALARDYTGMDIDAGGSRDLTTKDGKTLEEVSIGLVDPQWKPVKRDDKHYSDPEFWEDDECYDKWTSITDERWGWC